MISRRKFMLGSSAALAAPFVLRHCARAAMPIVRRDVMDMTANDQFFADYAGAIRQMHKLDGSDRRNWINQARIHADYCHHGGVEFLHWHRHYIRFFEQICAKLSGNPDFALPYWNWSKNSGRLPAPFFELQELNVEYWNDPGQYVGKAWGPVDTVGRRGLDKTHGLLDDPTRGGNFAIARINSIKQLPNIELFRPALEGSPHNNGHVITGATKSGKIGHIGDGLSPLDPIFWLHHCMVDRVWAEWQRSGHVSPDPGNKYVDQFVDFDGKPVEVSTGGAMNIADLGYTYDIFQNVSEAALAGAKVPTPTPQTLASVANSIPSRANVETAVVLGSAAVASRIGELRVQEAAGLSSRARLLAKLSDIAGPERNDLLVNVFVNCPYLSPETPYTDPHYAGTFSFFGARKMEGMPRMVSPTFVVDITAPVRDSGFAPDKIKLQFMPVMSDGREESSSTFQVRKIEILGV
jgi:tyrosinase